MSTSLSITHTRRRRQSYVRTLKAAGLEDSNSKDGAFSKWMHRFGEHGGIGRRIDQQLGLEKGT
jgi:hypothetical protein